MGISPTTPKGIRTRALILTAARGVFASEGYVDSRISDISESAGVSVGALFRYFSNKDDVFNALFGDLHEELINASRPPDLRLADDPYSTISAANLGYLRRYYENRDLMRVFVEAAALFDHYRGAWWRTRLRFVNRFVAAYQRLEVPGNDEAALRIRTESLACMVEHSAYAWYGYEGMADVHVPIEEGAIILSDIWYSAFRWPQKDARKSTPIE